MDTSREVQGKYTGQANQGNEHGGRARQGDGRRGPLRLRSEHAVTLIEMLVVVAIIGIFALVAVPSIGNYIRAARVRASNDALVADLRAARYIAITNRVSNTVSFDAASGAYSFNDIHETLVTRTLDQGADFTTLTNTPVTFKSDGGLITGPATIVIQGDVARDVTHRFTINVSAVGRVASAFTRN